MANGDRLAKLLLQATDSLEKAMLAKREGDGRTFSEKIWEVGADLEYFTFAVRLSMGSEDPDDLWKETLKTTRAVNVDGELLKSQRLLQEASSIITISLEEAYRRVWFAQEHILRVQGKLERTTAEQSR